MSGITGTPFLPSGDDNGTQETQCPECRGRCYDKYDEPCQVCMGEGVIDVEETPSTSAS